MTDDLRISVEVEPEPGLLRPAIEAALAGRPWPPGPEAQVAAAVVAAVQGSYAGRPDAVAGAATPGIQALGTRTLGTRTRGTRTPGIRSLEGTDHGGEGR